MILHRHLLKGRRCHKDHIWHRGTFLPKQQLERSNTAKDCFLTLVKIGLALGSSGCFVGQHARNGPIYRKMVVIVSLLVTSKTA